MWRNSPLVAVRLWRRGLCVGSPCCIRFLLCAVKKGPILGWSICANYLQARSFYISHVSSTVDECPINSGAALSLDPRQNTDVISGRVLLQVDYILQYDPFINVRIMSWLIFPKCQSLLMLSAYEKFDVEMVTLRKTVVKSKLTRSDVLIRSAKR